MTEATSFHAVQIEVPQLVQKYFLGHDARPNLLLEHTYVCGLVSTAVN